VSATKTVVDVAGVQVHTSLARFPVQVAVQAAAVPVVPSLEYIVVAAALNVTVQDDIWVGLAEFMV
jgi:hypothetical protein